MPVARYKALIPAGKNIIAKYNVYDSKHLVCFMHDDDYDDIEEKMFVNQYDL